MTLKIQPLCEMKKSVLKDHFDEIEKIVSKPRFICAKCLRVAHSTDYLCKAKKLKAN